MHLNRLITQAEAKIARVGYEIAKRTGLLAEYEDLLDRRARQERPSDRPHRAN